jgi:hypothetical protein
MECYKSEYDRGYTRSEIKRIEETLVWAEVNLKQPRINCLEGWREVTEYLGDRETRIAERNNETNLRWMRLFTTMSLTLSDGYVLFSDDNAIPLPDHAHNWYDFWDADLGLAVSPKHTEYRTTGGLYIREFVNGWAVYNRSGKRRTVEFELPVTAMHKGETGTQHVVADMDGEIFHKR